MGDDVRKLLSNDWLEIKVELMPTKHAGIIAGINAKNGMASNKTIIKKNIRDFTIPIVSNEIFFLRGCMANLST